MTSKFDDSSSYKSNRQEKLFMYSSHLSDKMSDGTVSLSKLSKLSISNKALSDITTEEDIDFMLPPKEDDEDSKIKGRHFYIHYDKPLKKYFVKDLGLGYGIFRLLAGKRLNTKSMPINYLFHISKN